MENDQAPTEVPFMWLDWVLNLLMKGASREIIIERSVERGAEAVRINWLLDSLLANPLLPTLLRQIECKSKYASLMNLQARLKHAREQSGEVARIESPSRNKFYEDYFLQSRPVLFPAPALDRDWSPSAIAAEYGDTEVSVTVGQRYMRQPPYDLGARRERRRIVDVANEILRPGVGDSLYITAEDRFFREDGVTSLFLAAQLPLPFLDASLATRDGLKLWMGPKGTHTPLHHDQVNLLIHQAHGQKTVFLAPPEEAPKLRNDFGCWSRYSFFDGSVPGQVLRLVARLKQGDCLFLPAGWWHEVVADSASTTITSDNFDIGPKEGFAWTGVYWVRHCPSMGQTVG